MKKVLLIEDDPVLHNNIKEGLCAENIHVESAYDGIIAEKILKRNYFDCVVLDINLPGKNGYDLCKEFRTFNKFTPLLMLTAFGELEDKVKGFDCGADDYLTKPFYIKELALRIKSLIKRSKNQITNNESKYIKTTDIVIDVSNKKVTRQGKEITLTPREYQIIVKLINAKGELVSKKDLLEDIWGSSFDANTNTIEVYINFLRKKIDRPFNKNNIKTKIGYGYYFEE